MEKRYQAILFDLLTALLDSWTVWNRVAGGGGAPLEGVIVAEANQEHGILAHRSGDRSRMPRVPVGTLLRILPSWERIRGW